VVDPEILQEQDVCRVVNMTAIQGVLPAGAGSARAGMSTAMEKTLRELESRFDIVIIDAPPLLPVTDAAVLSTIARGVVVVAGVGLVDRDHLAKSLQSLEAVSGRVLGLVVNRMPTKGADAHYYYQCYAPETPRQREEPKPAAT